MYTTHATLADEITLFTYLEGTILTHLLHYILIAEWEYLHL